MLIFFIFIEDDEKKTGKTVMGNYRFERKFKISQLNPREIELHVKLHPAMFKEIYYQRTVNSIYLDSIDKQSYTDNIVGLAKRIKTRVRYYGDLCGTIEKPVLELKKKSGFVNTKESFPISSFILHENDSHQVIWKKLIASVKSEVARIKLFSLEVVLLVRYSRKYFLSGCGKYRITIDTDLEFFNFNGTHNVFDQNSPKVNNTILELKYSHEHDENADKIVNHFPFRITRSSKYVSGIEKFS